VLIELIKDKDEQLTIFGINSGDKYLIHKNDIWQCFAPCNRIHRDCSGYMAKKSYAVIDQKEYGDICISKICYNDIMKGDQK
jgi:hypothetical protein